MILVDYEIAELCDGKDPLIYPFTNQEYLHGVSHGLGPASYDVRLDKGFYIPKSYKTDVMDLQNAHEFFFYIERDHGTFIEPGEFILASTMETIHLPKDMTATIRDKSTFARMGIAVQNTLIDPGFNGTITLEISNHSPFTIFLPAGVGICQLVFEKHKRSVMGYSGKYQNQKGVKLPC